MGKAPKKFVNNSLKDDGLAIGQLGDDIDIFPQSELKARIAKVLEQDAIIEGAIAQSEGEDLDDISDLDD